jgi:hypothetical protein
MANYSEHVLLRWGGTLGDDTWSCGLRLAGNTPGSDQSWAQGSLEDMAEVVRLFHTDSGARINALAKLAWVKLNAIDNRGHYASGEETNLFEFEPSLGSGFGSRVAPQLAVAVTLRTDKRRGYAHAGRIYLPTNMTDVDTTGHMDVSNPAAIATATKTFFEGIANVGAALGARYEVHVFSGHAGEHERVTRIEVGNVIDTQQRRRRQIDEVYTGVDLEF